MGCVWRDVGCLHVGDNEKPVKTEHYDYTYVNLCVWACVGVCVYF